MTKEEIEIYAKIYKRNQKIISFIISIVIIILGIGFSVGGIILGINEKILYKIFGVVLMTASVIDFIITYRFIKFSYNSIKYTSSRDAALKYCKVHDIK